MSEPSLPPPPRSRRRRGRLGRGTTLQPTRSHGTVETVIGVIALVIGFAILANGAAVVGVVALGIAAFLLFGGVRAFYQGRFWGTGSLRAPTGPVALNDRFTVGYRLDAKSAKATEHATIAAWLVCEERATYTQGSDTRTAKSEHYRAPLGVSQRFNDLAMEAHIGVEMPGSGVPASMALRNNVIEWRIEVEVTSPGAPDMNQPFVIQVRPEVLSEPTAWSPQ